MRRIRTKYGTKVVPDRYAAILTRMKGIEYDDEPEEIVIPAAPKPAPRTPPKPEPAPAVDPVEAPSVESDEASDQVEAPKRRTYRRRDLTAEE